MHLAKQKRTDLKGYKLNDSIYIKFLKKKPPKGTENRSVIARS